MSLTYDWKGISFLQKRLCSFIEQQKHVSQHDFIFSDHFRHRIARHAAFWFASYIFFLISCYLPGAVLPGWNIENFVVNSARIGVLKWLWMRLINSTITFLPLLAFAYIVIYFLLPRHLFNKKNWGITIILFFGMLLFILIIQYFSLWLVSWNAVKVKPGKVILDHNSMVRIIIKWVLNNYPVVAGFAVIIKMMKHGWLKQQETLQVAREKAKAELQLLKSQIHPHFLFNTLNNVYFLTLTASQKAPEMLVKLTDMLRYILNECGQSFVPLEKEIKMIEDYMALEKIRYGDRLKMELEIKGDYKNKMISPLLLIPLVENSFKHGASKMLEHPWVNLNITIEGQYLFFLLSNSRPEETILPQHNGHIGLNNVKKRLQLLYPDAYELSMVKGSESYEVFMKISLGKAGEIADKSDFKKESLRYELA
jgi:sensor histidine kinase YesM